MRADEQNIPSPQKITDFISKDSHSRSTSTTPDGGNASSKENRDININQSCPSTVSKDELAAARMMSMMMGLARRR